VYLGDFHGLAFVIDWTARVRIASCLRTAFLGPWPDHRAL
jgi:hypothetical protein